MQTPTTFEELVKIIIDVISYIIPAIFGLLFVYLVWKIIDAWVINAGDDTKREEGRRLMVIAVVVFVIMLSTWGIVRLIATSFFG